MASTNRQYSANRRTAFKFLCCGNKVFSNNTEATSKHNIEGSSAIVLALALMESDDIA